MIFISRLLRRRRRRARGIEEAQARRSILWLCAYLGVIGALHVAAMMAFEGLRFGDAAWLTATTITTVGYGDLSAATSWGRAATVALIYMGGIFALAKGAGDYFDYRAARRLRMIGGRWRWDMEDHILFINAPRIGAETYFDTLVRQFRHSDWGRERPVLVVTEAWPDGPPPALRELGVVHVHGRGDGAEALDMADAASAAAIIVLAEDLGDPRSDSVTFDVVHRLRGVNGTCPVLAECADDRNRQRLRDAGASAVVRPLRSYPEMLVRAVVAPGSESIIENLFTSAGDECRRYDVAVGGVAWGRLASALLLEGAGTPIAYADKTTGRIETNPPASASIDADAIFILVKEGHALSDGDVREVLDGLSR